MTLEKNADVSTMDIFKMLRGDFTPDDFHARRLWKTQAEVWAAKTKAIEEQYGSLSTIDLKKLRERRKRAHFRATKEKGFVYDAVKDAEEKKLLDVLYVMLSRRTDIPPVMLSSAERRREAARVNRGQGKSKNR